MNIMTKMAHQSKRCATKVYIWDVRYHKPMYDLIADDQLQIVEYVLNTIFLYMYSCINGNNILRASILSNGSLVFAPPRLRYPTPLSHAVKRIVIWFMANTIPPDRAFVVAIRCRCPCGMGIFLRMIVYCSMVILNSDLLHGFKDKIR